MSLTHAEADAFCRWVIAKDYYDGAMSGIALQTRDDVLIFFRVVGWDTEQWGRVFAITVVDNALGERLRALLAKLEPQREPFWLPGPQSTTPEVTTAWEDMLRAALETHQWRLVECHDLLGAVAEKMLPPAEAKCVAEMVRHEAVMDLQASPLLDEFLRQLRAHAG